MARLRICIHPDAQSGSEARSNPMVREHHKYRAKPSTSPARGAGQLPAHFARLPNTQCKHAKQNKNQRNCETETAKSHARHAPKTTHKTEKQDCPISDTENPSAVVTVLVLCFVLVIVLFLFFFLLALVVFERALLG